MKRPIGVTASAIFSLLGSLLFIGLWVLLLVMLIFRQRLPPMPTEARLGLVISLVMFGGLGAWGFITGIGLLRLSNWARISMVVFSVLLAFMGLLSAPVFLLMPMSPKMPPNFATVRMIMAAIYAAFGLLGAVWLYYFSRRATREVFSKGATTLDSGRPLSISIIGWWFLISGVITALTASLWLPGVVFIWILTGWSAVAWYLVFGGLFVYLGYGLLRLKPVARTMAIWALCFGVVNSTIFFALPGRDERTTALMSRFSQFPCGSATSPAQFPPTIVTALITVVSVGVPLWFLIRRKSAFEQVHVAPLA